MSENTPTPTPADVYELLSEAEVFEGSLYAEDLVERLSERLRALEVIRQRVSDGWTPGPVNFDPEIRWCSRDGRTEPFEPGVSGVLWPDEETQ